jgi:hypothetical protein
MNTFGIILILIGLSMGWSGFAAKWRMDHYVRITVSDAEFGYHILFRKIWWIPVGIGILLVVLF